MQTLNKKAELTFDNVKVTSAAQAMTLMAYGDCNVGEKAHIPFRNLSFKAECESFSDLAKCLEIIESYNDFDAKEMMPYLSRKLALKHYINENNPNNGNDLFKFEIAREGSPAFYVSLSPKWNKTIILNDGTHTEYTVTDFKKSMADLKELIKADEMDIEETHQITARFWFD